MIKKNPVLKSLNLSHNIMDSNSAKMIGEALT